MIFVGHVLPAERHCPCAACYYCYNWLYPTYFVLRCFRWNLL